MELKTVKIEKPAELNFILGQAHFAPKSIEDLHEVLVTAVPTIKFGIAFAEASGSCLIRVSGNDDELLALAKKNALKLRAGHTFIIFIRDAYPLNVLNAIKQVPEVCTIFCATANDTEVIIAESEQGCGILGVIDGSKSAGVETEADVTERKQFLRKLGYKL